MGAMKSGAGLALASAAAEGLGRGLYMARRRHHKEEPPSAEAVAYHEARKVVNARIRFFGHGVAWAATCLFLLIVASFSAAVVVGLSWGILLACHGYFAVVAPELRQRWVDQEVQRRLHTTVTEERRTLQGKHARSLEALSASIAHEIRNPITAAKSLVQQMGEDPACDDNVEFAKVALEELDRVESSISHLLRYARESDVQLEPMRMSDVIDSALETFRDRVDKSGVRVERDLDGDGAMRGDPEKLRRVVINLVGNALDDLEQTRPEGACVTVSSGQNLAGSEIWLRIKDNGSGISEARLEKIWSPFHTSKANGTGLGLAISKKLVESHSGSIEVSSRPGAGTEFLLVFPTGEDGAEVSS